MIVQTYFISTGKLNAMYTLRYRRVGDVYCHDVYLCNLAATRDLAVSKAETYVEALRERIGESSDFKIVFDGSPDFELATRRGALSVATTLKLEMLEQGLFPIGKHVGTRIEDANDGYILFFADKVKEDSQDVVFSAVAAACAGVALEKGLIAKREQANAERDALNKASQYVGEIGARASFTGEIIMVRDYETQFGINWVYKIRCGLNLVTYMGSSNLGERGDVITFKATVKNHEIYQEIKQTLISRPKLN